MAITSGPVPFSSGSLKPIETNYIAQVAPLQPGPHMSPGHA